MKHTMPTAVITLLLAPLVAFDAAETDAPIDIGSRRELLVDELLVERLAGKAELRLHHPTPREIVLVHDAPWEGNATAYRAYWRYFTEGITNENDTP